MGEFVHPLSCFLILAHPSRNSSNKPCDSSWDNAENLDTFRVGNDQYGEDSKPYSEGNLKECGHFRQENE